MKLKAMLYAMLGLLGAASLTVTASLSSVAYADESSEAQRNLLCSAFNRLTEHGQEEAIKQAIRETMHQDLPGMVGLALFAAHAQCLFAKDVLPGDGTRGQGTPGDPNLGTILQSILPPSDHSQG